MSSELLEEEEEEAAVPIKVSPAQHDKDDPFDDHYALENLVGQGGFAQVYRCTHKASGQARAVKVCAKSSKHCKALRREFEWLSQLNHHPNLVHVYEFFQDDEHLRMVTDLYEGGDLFDRVQTQGPLQEREAATALQRLLSVVHHCHEHNLAHRDLKMENILLSDSTDFHTLKLIDFGLAKQPKKKKGSFYDVVGSPSYISPQMIDGKYNRLCDVWALGVVAYVLLSGRFPFEDSDSNDPAVVIQNISKGTSLDFHRAIFHTYSPECADFVKHLLAYEERDRPTAEEALQHPWLIQQTQQVHFELAEALQTEIKASLKAMQQPAKNHNNKLGQAVGALITSQLLRLSQRETIGSVFQALDRNCHGHLTIADLQAAFGAYLHQDVSAQELRKTILPPINPSRSGALEFSEFAALVFWNVRPIVSQKELQRLVQEAFHFLDREQKGYIHSADLQYRLVGAEWEKTIYRIMFEVCGPNNPPAISKDAFTNAVLGDQQQSSSLDRFARKIDDFQQKAEHWSRGAGKWLEAKLTAP